MGLGRTLEATVIYDAPDGRAVYRPWGGRGPCFLVSPDNRWRFALYARVWYPLLLVLIWVLPFTFGPTGLFVGILGWMICSYVLMALLTIGLPTTHPPPTPTVEETNQALERVGISSRVIGLLMFGSLVMTVLSLLLFLTGFLWQGLLGGVSFGGLTAVYWHRRRSMSAVDER